MPATLRRFLKSSIGVAAAAAAAAFFGYLIWQLGFPVETPLERELASFLTVLFSVLAALFGLRLASRAAAFDPRLRRAWALLAFSSLCTAVAVAVRFALEAFAQASPFPSWADLLYLGFYPLRLAGIVALPFVSPRRSERATLLLDLGIIVAAGFIGLWYFVVAPLWGSAAIGLADLVAIAYPVADLILIGGLAILIQRDLEHVRRLAIVFLALSLALLSTADTGFAFGLTHGVAQPHGLLPALRVASALCDLLAVSWMLVLGQHAPRGARPPYRAVRIFRLTLPYLAAILGLSVLVIAGLIYPMQPRWYLVGTLFGSLALMTLAMLRQFVVLRENIALQEEASRLATTDSLTGLSNRRVLDTLLSREVERAMRYAHPLSVVILDLDGFKAYNDRHGHLQGDIALQRVSLALRSQVRSIDLLARFGGDEFVLLLPETTWEGATAVGTKMREAIRKQHIPGSPISLSVGVAEYHPGMTPADLLNEADQALYRDKHGHRQLPLEQPGSPKGGTKPLSPTRLRPQRPKHPSDH